MTSSTKIVPTFLPTALQYLKKCTFTLAKENVPVKKDQSIDKPDNFNPSLEFVRYERSVANNLGYFAVSRTCFTVDQFGNYGLRSSAPVAQGIYFFFVLNTFVKSVFLFFLITDYFGPVVFLDKIAALDYILCVCIVILGHYVWVKRYPIHEIIHSLWTIKNDIYHALGYPEDVKRKVERDNSATVWTHLIIVWLGCICLLVQVYADPKYCGFTYSAIEYDSWALRTTFFAHEFFFMMHAWHSNVVITSLSTIEAISISNLMAKMTESVKNLYKSDHTLEKKRLPLGNNDNKMAKSVNHIQARKSVSNEGTYDNIDKLIFDYKQLMLITDMFNRFVANKLYLVHLGAYCQLISDVFVAIQVLKLEGTGFMDVWFYLEDCCIGVFLIYRVYSYMAQVSTQSKNFLMAFREYRVYGCPRRKLHAYRKISKSLKLIGLQLGPFIVTPMTVLSALQTFGDYYVCVALW